MYSKKQQGKGLIPFLAGSAVALIAITIMLLTLNRNSEKAFRQPELANKPQEPEILTPSIAAPSVPQSQVTTTMPTVPPMDMASAVSPKVNNTVVAPSTSVPAVATKPKVEPEVTDKQINQAFEDNMAMQSSSEVAVVKPKVEPQKPVVAKEKPKETVKPKPVEKADTKIEDVKPTAQQILDSGNIEKAREVARKEAQAKAQLAAKNKETKEKNVANTIDTNKNNSKNSGTVSIQAGAYGNRKSAEDQRAKLALMGVQTQVVQVKSGGKTVYRVQTVKMQGDKANQVQQTLQKNGINTYTHK